MVIENECSIAVVKSGSTAKVVRLGTDGGNGLASVSGDAALFATLNEVVNGGCCASSMPIDW